MKISKLGHKGFLRPGLVIQTACDGTFSAKPEFKGCTVVDVLSTQFTVETPKGRIQFLLFDDVGQTWTF